MHYRERMKTVSVQEAKANLSRLLQGVEAGEEITIAREGTPVARLVPFTARLPRVPGRLKGQIVIADDFDDPLPDEFWPGSR